MFQTLACGSRTNGRTNSGKAKMRQERPTYAPTSQRFTFQYGVKVFFFHPQPSSIQVFYIHGRDTETLASYWEYKSAPSPALLHFILCVLLCIILEDVAILPYLRAQNQPILYFRPALNRLIRRDNIAPQCGNMLPRSRNETAP